MLLLRDQHLSIEIALPSGVDPPGPVSFLSRAQRAHSRLDFQERLARNTRGPTAPGITIRLFGVPERFALLLGLAVA